MNDIKEILRCGMSTFLVSPGLQQEPHHLEVSFVAGKSQGRLLELVAVGVDSGAELEENLEIGDIETC